MKKILWLTWKDLKHPQSGGAEIVDNEIAKRLVKNGYQVIFLTSKFKNCLEKESIDGYQVIRLGGRFSVYWAVYRYFKKHLAAWPDLIIEEVNTMPFFSKFYSHKPTMLLFYQLCREKWLHEMFWPLSWIGYMIEPLYLKFIKNLWTITVSESTKKDLEKNGFLKQRIGLMRLGLSQDFHRCPKIAKDKSLILGLGSVRPSKKTLDTIRAFEIVKKEIPRAKLIIAGKLNGYYGRKVLRTIRKSKYTRSIKYRGFVNQKEKIKLLARANILAAPAIKEGWGLVISEANSQKTPAVAYKISGFQDSVIDNQTGLLCNPNHKDLARQIITLFSDQQLYDYLSNNSYKLAQKMNFDNTYQDFILELKRFKKGQFLM